MTDDADRRSRLAVNEALARDANELAEGVAAGFVPALEPLEFRCECSRAQCREAVRLTREEYESVRADALRFVLVAGHEDLEIDRVVGYIREYPIVEKFDEEGRAVARETDPRA